MEVQVLSCPQNVWETFCEWRCPRKQITQPYDSMAVCNYTREPNTATPSYAVAKLGDCSSGVVPGTKCPPDILWTLQDSFPTGTVQVSRLTSPPRRVVTAAQPLRVLFRLTKNNRGMLRIPLICFVDVTGLEPVTSPV